MKKPIPEKIEYKRKMANGEIRTYFRKNSYKQRVRPHGTQQVSRKNFIRSYNRHFDKNGKDNFISVEMVENGVFLLHYAPEKPLKEGEGIWQVPPLTTYNTRSKDTLISAINQMKELDAWKSKDYKAIFRSIIIENSVSKFNSQFKSLENCYLLYPKDTLKNLLKERMGISEKMAKRLISSLLNRIKYPFLYNQQKITDSQQPSITSEKELFLELNLYAILKSVVSRIDTFRENFLDEETTEEERIKIIVDYIIADEHDSYANSKIAYELGDTDLSLEKYSKDNSGNVLKEISKNREDYISQFKTFLDGTINYLEETYQVPFKTTYLVDSIAEKIVPFMELHLLESVLGEVGNGKIKYDVRFDIRVAKGIEKKEEKVDFEDVMEKLKEGKELYELYKDLKESSGISIILDSALASEHKHTLEQFMRYDEELVSDIASPELVIDLHQAVEYEREYYLQLTNKVRKIAKVLDIKVN